MIRPLIESIYDYRITFAPETNPATRNTYKPQYYEACTLIAAEQTLAALSRPKASLETAISEWNSANKELNRERRESKVDPKSKVDELFRGAGKNCYKREYDRPISRERSEDVKERHSGDHHHHHSRSRDYGHGHNSYKHDHHGKYRNERY
jgi:hypothetical protein